MKRLVLCLLLFSVNSYAIDAVKAEVVKSETKVEAKKAEVKVEAVKSEAKVEAKKAEVKAEAVKSETKVETKKAEVKAVVDTMKVKELVKPSIVEESKVVEMQKRDSVSAEIKTVVDSIKATEVKKEVVVEPKPVVVPVAEITDAEREALIKKSLKEKEAKEALQKKRIEKSVATYVKNTDNYMKKLKSFIRQEHQYNSDLEKITKSTFLSKRDKNKKIPYTKKRLEKIYVLKKDYVDGLEQESYKIFENIVSKNLSYINSFTGTEKIIEKMNLRLELMKTGQAILGETKSLLSGSYGEEIVEEIVDDMDKNFVRKYEELVKAIK